MAVKSLVEVEIDDSAFQRFQAAFADYAKVLDSTPDAWAKVSK